MKKTITTGEGTPILPLSYRHADKPSSVGALWVTALGLALFWIVVAFFAKPLVSRLMDWWLA